MINFKKHIKQFLCVHKYKFTGETIPTMCKHPTSYGIADFKEFYQCVKCSKHKNKSMTVVGSYGQVVDCSNFKPYREEA